MLEKEGQEADFLNSVAKIIEKNIQNDAFSIEQLCQELNLSRTHVHRKIKAATKLSTSLFIRKIRLEKARQLLEESDYNISEIAYLTGNKSPQNFSKYFIKEFGLSPSAYRKKIKTSGQKKEEVNPLTQKVSNQSKWTILTIGLVLGLLFLLGFTGKQYLWPEAGLDSLPSASPAIAVIPFQNESPTGDDFLSEGIVEDILTKLSQFENLKIISKASTEPFKDTRKNIKQIGTILGVNYVLEGHIRQDGNRVIINTQLVSVSDNQVIWTDHYDRSVEQLISIQAEVAENIAEALNQRLQPVLQIKLASVPTTNKAAYTAMLRGRYLMRSRTQEDLLRSKEQFLMALDLDPEYSQAYEGLARACYLLISLGYDRAQVEMYNELVEKNALKAIQFDRDNGKAYAILGNLYAGQYRWEEAISAFEIALDLKPNDAMINYWFSLTLRSIGDLERALAYHQIASKLDPLHPVIHAGYVYTCAIAGEFELAEEILDKVEPIMTNSFLYYIVRGNLLLRKGDFQAAIPLCEKALEMNPTFKFPESDQFYCLGKLGQKQQVLDYIDALDQTQAIGCLRAAKAFMGINDQESALHSLRKSADLGLINDDLLVEPIFFSLRNHPIYLSILEEYNLAPFSEDIPSSLN